MPPRRKGQENGSESLGFENLLWKAADKLRGQMDSRRRKGHLRWHASGHTCSGATPGNPEGRLP